MNRNKILLEKDGATNSKVQGSPLLNKCAKDKEYGILSQVFTDALRWDITDLSRNILQK